MAQNALELFKRIKNDQELRNYEPSWRDKIAEYAGKAYAIPYGEENRTTRDMGHRIAQGLDFTPVGAATYGNDAYRKAKEGNYLGAAIDAGSAMLSAIPYAGPKALKYLREPNRTLSVTHEAIPAANSGHVPQIVTASLPEKTAYTETGSWTGSGTDALYNALGLPQRTRTKSTGMYLDENQPLDISHVIFKDNVNPDDIVPVVEHFRGLTDAQGAAAAHFFDTSLSGNGALINMGGRQPTGQQLSVVNDLLNPHGFGISSSQRGAVIFPFDGSTPMEVADDVLAQLGPKLQEVFPAAKIQRGKPTTYYQPTMDKWDANYNQVPTAGQGEATTNFFEKAATADPYVIERLSADPNIRNILNEKIVRDAAMGEARPDVQHTREFFRDADWAKAIDLIRKGMPPAVALGTLGYSLSAMADDNSRLDR